MNRISAYKKTKIEEETTEEFYLNPKDMLNHDKIFESNQTDLMIYLPFNELLIVLFEQNIVVIDIKRTISSNFTIIKMINHIELFQDCFLSQDEKRSKVPSKDLTFNSYCLKIKENDFKKIKNMIAIETKSDLNEIYFLIEYMNLDFVIIKYNNIYVETKYSLIYSHTKNYFIKHNKFLKMNYESIMILNYQSKLYSVVDETGDLSKSTYIIHQVENSLFVSCVDNDSYNQISVINVNMNIKVMACASHNNTLIQVVADVNNIIQCNFYSSFKLIYTQDIAKENEGNVTLIRFDTYIKKKIVLYAQLNNVALYSIDEKSAHLTHMNNISFNQFDDWVISYSFILNNVLYIFNSNGDYSYNSLDSKENNLIQSLNISRQIYSIANFQTNIGVFILSTQNTIRLTNVNITYFIPKAIAQHMTLKMLIDISNVNKNSFYTFSFCEFLMFYIRFHMKKDRDKEKEKESNAEDKDKPIQSKGLIEKRIEIYYNQINNKSIIKLQRDIIDYYHKSNGVKNEKASFYLNNRFYKCDFCLNQFILYQHKVFICKENHQTFSCCVTNIPFNANFFQCINCHLFYDNKFKICVVCQQMLSYAL